MTIIISEKGSRGRPGLVWRGEWSGTMDYYAKDVVTRDGSSYIAARFIRADATAYPRVTADWEDFALKGADGTNVVIVSATEPVGNCSVSGFLSESTCEAAGNVWSSVSVGDLWFDTSIGRLFARVSDGSLDSWYDITGVILGTDVSIAADGNLPAGDAQTTSKYLDDRITSVSNALANTTSADIAVPGYNTFPPGSAQAVLQHTADRIEAIETDVDNLDATDIPVSAQGTFPSASTQATVKHLDDRITALSFGVESLQATDIPVAASGDLPAGDLQSVLEHLDEKAITSSVDPALSRSVVEGDLWYDTNSNQINVYRDNTWVVLATKAALGDHEGYDDISMNGGYF